MSNQNPNVPPVSPIGNTEIPIFKPNENGGLMTDTASNSQIVNLAAIGDTVVILYGSPSVGKTAVLVRLCRYINNETNGAYLAVPNRDFKTDAKYQKAVSDFQTLLAKDDAPKSTTDFLLVDIQDKNSKYICSIVESPGEDFFKVGDTEKKYPMYLLNIFNSDRRKIHLFFFETQLFHSEGAERDRLIGEYCKKIRNHISQNMISKSDSIILLYNKADENPGFFQNKRPVRKRFLDNFYNITNKTLKEVIKGYTNDFVIFSAGITTKEGNDNKFSNSPAYYPKCYLVPYLSILKMEIGYSESLTESGEP